MKSIVKFIIAESAVVATAVALISSAYIYVLPQFFDDRRTYSVFVFGLAIAAVSGGYVARTEWVPIQLSSWSFTIAISGIIAVVTHILSMLFILNIRGS